MNIFDLRSDATQALRANVRGARSRLPKRKRFGGLALLAIAAFLLPSLASAQQMLTLKPAPASIDTEVTVGDVFDNAGPMAKVVIGHRTGATVLLDAATVQSIVGANGGYWANPRGQRRIQVTAEGAGSKIEPTAATGPLQPPNPFTQAAAPAPSSNNPFASTSPAVASAPALAAMEAAPPPRIVPVAVQTARAAIVVHRTDTIDVTWSDGGLSLTMSGVAQKDAAVGDTVAVQNPTSKKMIDALIIGPGRGIAGPGADNYRATQLSSR